MNPFRGRLPFVFAILAMASTNIHSSTALAQTRAQGEFRLSQATHWETSILPRGQYLFSVDTDASPAVVRVQQKGGAFAGAFPVRSQLRVNPESPAEIVMRHVGDSMYISSLRVRQLKSMLEFSTPGDSEVPGGSVANRAMDKAPMDLPADNMEPHDMEPSHMENSEWIKIVNPNHLYLSIAAAEKVYLNACRLVEVEFNRTSPIRPKLTLQLGAEENIVRYPNGVIMLKKWDEFRFAQGVVEFALHDLISPEERQRLSDAAVNRANTSVSVCELKNCRN